jgi:hypothetical protein
MQLAQILAPKSKMGRKGKEPGDTVQVCGYVPLRCPQDISKESTLPQILSYRKFLTKRYYQFPNKMKLISIHDLNPARCFLVSHTRCGEWGRGRGRDEVYFLRVTNNLYQSSVWNTSFLILPRLGLFHFAQINFKLLPPLFFFFLPLLRACLLLTSFVQKILYPGCGKSDSAMLHGWNGSRRPHTELQAQAMGRTNPDPRHG